ncbi:MAG: peptidase P60 [Devosiaceae bacterium]|nr:peptidase P60 [Devosiaceae bacterium MH13]
MNVHSDPDPRAPASAALRERVAAEAVRWIGTPYCHQARRRGVGCDCLGLIAGVWEAVFELPVTLQRTERRDWAAHTDGEPLLEGLGAHLIGLQVAEASAGDVLALRWRTRWPASHLAVLMADDTIIHAYEGGRVVRSNLRPWASHVAAAFRFPSSPDVTR